MRSSFYFKTITQILILAILHLSWLTSYGYAEMVPTESAFQVQDDRQRILDLLDRQEVIDELKKYDISKVEAVARINSLTGEEVTQIAGKLDELAAGRYKNYGLANVIFIPIIVVTVVIGTVFFSCMCLVWSLPFAILVCPFKAEPYGSCVGGVCRKAIEDNKKLWEDFDRYIEAQFREEASEKVEQEPDSVMVEEECDPGMESCT